MVHKVKRIDVNLDIAVLLLLPSLAWFVFILVFECVDQGLLDFDLLQDLRLHAFLQFHELLNVMQLWGLSGVAHTFRMLSLFQ